jgi:protein tyrosine phosphatase (PTP) superfamily phosphohydrolase (DUF442 family)
MSRRMVLLALLTTAGLSGCTGYRQAGYTAQKPPCACGQGVPPSRLVPTPLPPRPPGAVEGVAPSTFVPAPPPAETVPPPPASLDRPIPPPPSTPEATTPSVQLGVPVPRRTESARVPLDPAKDPPVAAVPKAPATEEERDPPQPTDVPGYIIARPNVATGLKPFPDGISWLRDRGYKAVLHLRVPGEDNAAARRQFEKKGLKYLSLEVSPAALTKAVYDQFVADVVETANHPLYVYDQNGSTVSALWYLYFRVKMDLDDEKALAEIKRIGLKLDDDDDHKKAWLAAQALLATLKP